MVTCVIKRVVTQLTDGNALHDLSTILEFGNMW